MSRNEDKWCEQIFKRFDVSQIIMASDQRIIIIYIYIYIRCVRRIDDKSKGQRETGATERNAASDEKVRGEGMVKVARGAPFEQREVSASSS